MRNLLSRRWNRIRGLGVSTVVEVMVDSDDEQRAGAAQTADTTPSFESFWAAHRDRIGRAIAMTIGDAQLAADAVDEAMARAYQRWPQVAAMANPTAWVYRVGLNWSRSLGKRLRRQPPMWLATPGASHDEPAAEPAIDVALAALPVGQRAVVICRLLLGLSAITVPWGTLLLSVVLYIVIPVIVAQVVRRPVELDHQGTRPLGVHTHPDHPSGTPTAQQLHLRPAGGISTVQAQVEHAQDAQPQALGIAVTLLRREALLHRARDLPDARHPAAAHDLPAGGGPDLLECRGERRGGLPQCRELAGKLRDPAGTEPQRLGVPRHGLERILRRALTPPEDRPHEPVIGGARTTRSTYGRSLASSSSSTT